MNTTQEFQRTIKAHLDNLAGFDDNFAQKYAKEGKSIEECCNYILSSVQKSGCNGFTDDEIFGMAVHYYEENDLGDIKVNQCYGKHNQPTDRHEEILNAVNSNMWQIRDICQRKDWKQCIRQQGIAVNF